MKLHLTLTAAALLAAGIASAQTADEIVKKHTAAMGGEAWKKVTSLKFTGSSSANGMELPITRYVLKGKGMRMDIDIQGSINYQIVTPTDGWMFFPIQGQTKPEPIPAEEVKASQSMLEVGDNLMNYAANGSKPELAGKEKIGDVECFKLKITGKDGQSVTDYVDAKTYYIVRETQMMKAEGKEQEVTTNFSNYQKLPEGIYVAMTVESAMGPLTVKTVEVNTIKDDSIFKPSGVK